MIDRFGKLDVYTKQFLELIIIKILSAKKGVQKITSYKQNVTITLNSGKEIDLKARSYDDDDVINVVLEYLRGKEN
jgi:transcription-repair coupling factor (superfamily II helicase)